MKKLSSITFILVTGFLLSCTKEKIIPPFTSQQQIIPVPNGSFETWDAMYNPVNWTTNSCAVCLGPFITDIVQPDSDACNGVLAAKFIYNQVYAAWAENRFSVSTHPSDLTACVKCNLNGTDTVLIKVSLLHNSSVVDSGEWTGTVFIGNYSVITIPITQNASQIDSAVIFIRGGKGVGSPSNGTKFWVDNLELH
jgi:hypothetical protein